MNNEMQSHPDDALRQSYAVQASASAEGFDWPHVAGVLEKVEEEVGEIRAAVTGGDAAGARRELGDLLLVAVNLARFLGADPRLELLEATRRFQNRFAFLKESLASDGKSVGNCTLDELEARWQSVKTGADQCLSTGLDMGRVHGANSRTKCYESLDFKGQNEGVDNLLETSG